jgi:hypothetical protein
MSGEEANLPSRGPSRWPWALLTLGFLGLTVASALSHSAVPVVLGRYSVPFFGYQLVNLAILSLLAIPMRWRVARPLGAILVIGSTFLAPTNEAVGHMPGLLVDLPALRLLAGFALVAYEFDRFRADRRQARGAVAGLGAAVVVLSLFDLGFWVATRSRPDFRENLEGFRDRYDLKGVTAHDVLLVGDSFVWGDGVAKGQKFGDVLERLYARDGRRVRVFSLGIRGAGPAEYVQSLSQVPEGREAGVVIFSFFPNDIAPRARPRSRLQRCIQSATWPLSRSSLSFHALHDLVGRIETPGIAYYHQMMIGDYRQDDPTFPARWGALIDALGRFARLSRERCPNPPLLLIIPFMVDYHDYLLAQAHRELAPAAEGLGYDVLDLFPSFRASPNDIHCDARVYALIAERLKEYLDARPSAAGLGRQP